MAIEPSDGAKPMQRYAVMAEAVQDPYHDLRLISRTLEAASATEAARKALAESPHSRESFADGELLVFKISNEPAQTIKVSEL